MCKCTKHFLVILIAGFAIGSRAVAGYGIGVTSPPEFAATLDGNAAFEARFFAAHFQQVFPASEFGALPPRGALLRTITYYQDPLGPVYPPKDGFGGVEIRVSTVTRDGSSLSPVFSENLGLDDFELIRPGDLHSLGRGIDLSSSSDGFLYDPAKGNLLLDVRGLALPFIVDGFRSDHPISVWQLRGDGSLPAGKLTVNGLVTGFGFWVVPEPGVGLITTTGLVCLAALRWFGRLRKDPDVTR